MREKGRTMQAAGGIEVTGVRCAFGSVLAVDHIDLLARPGEVTALVGPNSYRNDSSRNNSRNSRPGRRSSRD
jgi:ABC-type uncharacterized transport system ATPase subunit